MQAHTDPTLNTLREAYLRAADSYWGAVFVGSAATRETATLHEAANAYRAACAAAGVELNFDTAPNLTVDRMSPLPEPAPVVRISTPS